MSVKTKKTARALSPFLVWPRFVARQPSSIRGMVSGLMDSQWSPLDEIRAGWQQQLTLLLGWAANNVAYYKQRAQVGPVLQEMHRSNARFWELWWSLPILTKVELRQHGDRLRTPKLPPHHHPTTLLKTSGSTGIPVEVLSTRVTACNWSALTLRDHLVWRRDFRKRMGAIRFLKESARRVDGVRMPDWGRPVNDLYQSGPGGAIHIGHPPDVVARWLRRLNPAYLLTYPSAAEQLLHEMGPGGKAPALEEVRFMSEPLDQALKERLHDEWGVRSVDMYSANETGIIAMTCPEHDNLHVQAETVYVELLNDAGADCEPGEAGRVVVTPLHNLATPLIRYEIGDYATAGEPCPCGRASPVIKQVLGRVRNYALSPDGKKFWPGSLGMVRSIAPILQAQYVQVAAGTIELRIVLERPLSDEEKRQAIVNVRTALNHPYNVQLRPVESIERGPTGKYEEFVSLINEPGSATSKTGH